MPDTQKPLERTRCINKPHPTLQKYGFTYYIVLAYYICVCMCLFKLLEWLNVFLHTLHEQGFSSVCVSICAIDDPFEQNLARIFCTCKDVHQSARDDGNSYVLYGLWNMDRDHISNVWQDLHYNDFCSISLNQKQCWNFYCHYSEVLKKKCKFFITRKKENSIL